MDQSDLSKTILILSSLRFSSKTATTADDNGSVKPSRISRRHVDKAMALQHTGSPLLDSDVVKVALGTNHTAFIKCKKTVRKQKYYHVRWLFLVGSTNFRGLPNYGFEVQFFSWMSHFCSIWWVCDMWLLIRTVNLATSASQVHTLPAVVDSLAGERVQLRLVRGYLHCCLYKMVRMRLDIAYEVTSVLCRRRGILMGQSKKRTARERYRPRHDHSSCCVPFETSHSLSLC